MGSRLVQRRDLVSEQLRFPSKPMLRDPWHPSDNL